MRKLIIDEHPTNPKYYDKMSSLLDAIIDERRKGTLDYQSYLAQLLEQAGKLGKAESDTIYPIWAKDGAQHALIDFGLPSEDIAQLVDVRVRERKPDQWVGNFIKEKIVRRALIEVLPDNYERVDELLNLIKARNEYK